ncbi:unnamed protein product [Rotaria sp. Silwood1]|nr:unnamed protein product [Rotaria sp. Silwood1]CAF1326653.1 unnamed protein product [Rotaria sp. Silwood1]CAF3515524.1 unnamed protein product [Rotaria sp. Silwood1]CAF4602829.1 unnamed protein product [Rotaria sp. Silwood1]
MLDIEWPFATHMDFRGQKMAERLFQVIIVLFGIIGFIAGYMMQQFSMTIYSVLFGVLISALLTLPPWPMYRNNPVEWQKPIDSNKETITNKNATSAKSPKKDVRKSKGKKDE